ncbi:NAD(P)/FAD-dependent oxidoreductase [Inquilinus sp. CAU 1745]|uniref:NAD(P)/FAD-dependent oxidoreductase n=1 Tax=Inquilinus sp. CAU 1745 TaxID=3140369 RepID=UPI00325BF8EE
MPHRIMIVGGGAGGLELACRLGRKRRAGTEIVLVDMSPSHLWKPLLHQVAAGTLNSYHDEMSYIALARANGFRFLLGALSGLDRQARTIGLSSVRDDSGKVIFPERTAEYDTLVIAIGSVGADFGVPGVREHCRFLDRRDQAERFHRALLGLLARNSIAPARPPARVAIVGGGATGVELSAEIREAAQMLRRYGVDLPDPALSLTLIERADRILEPLPPEVSEAAAETLEKLGVRILTGRSVTGVEAACVHLDDETRLESDLTVWAAGVKAPSFLKGLGGLETSPKTDQIVVGPTLQSATDPTIYAMGDCAYAPGPDGRPLPPRAQTAHQQASYLAKALPDHLDRKTVAPFVYRDRGSLVSLAHYSTVGNLISPRLRRSMMIDGWAAFIAYRLLYRNHQSVLLGPARTAAMMMIDQLRRTAQPELKMH